MGVFFPLPSSLYIYMYIFPDHTVFGKRQS